MKKIKATMLIQNSFGLNIARHINLTQIRSKKSSQFPYCSQLVIQYILKGKRKEQAAAFDEIVIKEGWSKLPNGAFNNENSTNEASNLSFDTSSFYEMVNELKESKTLLNKSANSYDDIAFIDESLADNLNYFDLSVFEESRAKSAFLLENAKKDPNSIYNKLNNKCAA